MALHPILALNHVIDEYRDYLRTEFRAKDPGLRQALEQALDEPLFLAQEPFFQAHRPFQSGKRWQELPIDPKLAQVMQARSQHERAYLHQSEAIDELLAPNARPVVVTTGTGSGKTEAFLLPVMQNAIEDAVRFKQNGLTAILVYPMNALANDQLLRIQEYLRDAGFSGVVSVRRYDRSTPQAERQAMRQNPPHILLTNYMMLEYLLVRPADREDMFANHRCRFLVLDEVHTYRGTLGSHIALLVRRLRTHLARARQDWQPDVPAADQARRYPTLVPVGTSATIKSLSDTAQSPEAALRLRDVAVQAFFSKLTGVDADTICVFGEAIEAIQVPPQAAYAATPVASVSVNISDPDRIRTALCALADVPSTTSLEDAATRCRLLWDLNRWLTGAPMSISGIYMLDGSEIDFELEGPWDTGESESRLGLVALTFIGPSLGGTGYLDRAAEDFHWVARCALEHLEHANCDTACYRCLKSYANQRFHEVLRWPLAVPHLEALAADAPQRQPTAMGDIDDPGPWLEAYAAGVGSPLELKFLRLFEAHGFHPEKQVPIAPHQGEAPISVADFAVPEQRLAIYIDGASVHVGANLRRDRHIRVRLRNGDPPWQVEELRAQDLREGRALVERLKR
jgi:hypothetical protein